MRIGFTYDLQTNLSDERQAEFDQPRTIAALEDALHRLGHEVVRLGNAEQLLAAPARLEHIQLVFNIAEGSHGRCREAWVPMLLEQWGVPFVGSGAATQALGLDKVMSKRVAAASGLATPRWVVVTPDDRIAMARAGELTFPLIVKPRAEGSGLGIDAGAIVHDMEMLARRVEWLTTRLHVPCLVEEFIAFGELTVFLIGNRPPVALPAVQRPLDPKSRLACHVAGHAARGWPHHMPPPPQAELRRMAQARWAEQQVMGWLSPVELTPTLEHAASRMAVTMFETLRCRDMARVDLRVDERATPYFLEINPLPSFDPEGSVGLIAECLGTTYTHLIGQILNAALQRLALPMVHVPMEEAESV